MSKGTTQSKVNSTGISVGFRSRWLNNERLKYMSQVGVQKVFVDTVSPGYEADVFPDAIENENRLHLKLSPDHIPSVEHLAHIRSQVEGAGLELAGIHSLHYGMYGDIMFDREGRDKQIDAITTLIKRLGEAGIGILGYQWNPRGIVPMRTKTNVSVRGGAKATQWNEEDLSEIEEPPGELKRTYSEEECWEYYEHFLNEIIPIVENEGVKLALHPTDPPVYKEIGGIPRLFRSAESFERALAALPSDAHGLKFCLGCFSEMGENIPELIKNFADDIIFVHFRDVVGTVPKFTETFLDAGNFNPHKVMEALANTEFSGPVLLDHVPHIEGDTEWRHRSRAYGAGYLRCLIEGQSVQINE